MTRDPLDNAQYDHWNEIDIRQQRDDLKALVAQLRADHAALAAERDRLEENEADLVVEVKRLRGVSKEGDIIKYVERAEAAEALVRELRAAAVFLFVANHQDCIIADPTPGRVWELTDLHPSIWNGLTSAERGLYSALAKSAEGESK
jgi:hypothetical protein